MSGIAYAMGQSGAAATGGSSGLMSLVPLLLMFVIFYFLLIRPQQKKAKEHRDMVQNLKKGDMIITGGGIYGRVTGVDDTTLTVEIADKVRVKLGRSSVTTVLTQAQAQKEQASEKG